MTSKIKSERRHVRRALWWWYFVLCGMLFFLLGVRPSIGQTPAISPFQRAPTVVPLPISPEPELPNYERGYLPHGINFDHLSEAYREAPPSLEQTLPSRWDWRDQGVVTGVSAQGECGSCYAFAGIGSFESQLAMRGEGIWDFSEKNVRDCNYGSSRCAGGNIWNVANHLSRYGAVTESCDPYSPYEAPCNTLCPPVKVADQLWVLGGSTVPPTALLKSWLRVYGPLYVTMDSGASSATWGATFEQYDGSYTLYRPGSYELDHAVLLVGWDDGLRHSGGQGAWLVKNSWGINWGNGGYFGMAYESAGLGSNAAVIMDWHDPRPEETLLHHDRAGFQDALGCRDQRHAYALVRFVPTSSGCIEQIELWTIDRTRQIAISIYDAFDGHTPSGLLRELPSTRFDHAGYHPIPIDPPLAVTAGNDIYVMAFIENESVEYPLPMDGLAPAQAGRSYLSCSGLPGSWADIVGYREANIGVRARMAGCTVQATPTASSTPSRTPTPTRTYTPTPTITPPGPMLTPLPKEPRSWIPLALRHHQGMPAPIPTSTVTPTSTRTITATPTHTVTPEPTDTITQHTLFSTADACVLEGYPTFNAGDTRDMWAGYDDDLDPGGRIVRSLVRFDIADLPPGRAIVKATLRLHLVSSWDFPDRSRTITTHRITANWAENSVTWNNKPGYAEAYGSRSIVSAAWGWYDLDVTHLVSAWYNGTHPNYGIMVRGPEVSGQDASWRGFGTRESSYVPHLIVETRH